MNPCSTPPQRRLLLVLWYGMLACVLLGSSGCAEEEQRPPSSPPQNDRALAVLQGLRYDYLQDALQRLDSLDHVRIVETVAIDEQGDTTGFQRLRVAIQDGSANISDSVKLGQFRSGMLGRWFAPERSVLSRSDAARLLIPQDPPYLLSVNRASYDITYVDSLDEPQLYVRLLNDGEVESDVRKVALTFERESRQVTTLEVHRSERSFLQETESIARIELLQMDGQVWHARSLYVRQRRQAPLQRPYDYATLEYYLLPGVDSALER